MPHISSILVYPVKSCKAISVQRAKIQPTGLEYDRQWMVVRADTGKFLSSRTHPILVTVSVSLPGWDAYDASGEPHPLPPDATLVLSVAGRSDLHVPLTRDSQDKPELRTVTVWEWTGPAIDEGDEAARWFTELLGTPARLVRFINQDAPAGEVAFRPTSEEFAVGFEMHFANSFPFMMASEASLADLNSRLPEAVPMDRFRPNLVASDCPAWWEDSFRSVLVTSHSASADDDVIELHSIKPCDRCIVPTINMQTGHFDGDEPSLTLGEFRSGKILGLAAQRKMWTHSVFFGANLVTTSSGVLRIGDVLEATGPQHSPLVPFVAHRSKQG